ncbi:hypothetical protein TELCIR_24442, partial [Teladorsagia circumcincta]
IGGSDQLGHLDIGAHYIKRTCDGKFAAVWLHGKLCCRRLKNIAQIWGNGLRRMRSLLSSLRSCTEIKDCALLNGVPEPSSRDQWKMFIL